MKRITALQMGIDALQHESKRLLFASDSMLSDQKRISIAEAIEVLDEIQEEVNDVNNSNV